MSHVEVLKTVLKDKNCIKASFERLGGVWNEDKTTFSWFGRSVGDYPIPEGFTVADMGKCTHSVSFADVRYEVGIIEVNRLPQDHPARKIYEAGSFLPMFDFFDRKLSDTIGGKSATKFLNAYNIEKAKREYLRAGIQVTETKVGTKTKLTAIYK